MRFRKPDPFSMLSLTGVLTILVLTLSPARLSPGEPRNTDGEGTINHEKLIRNRDLDRGREVYKSACVSCHGTDGKETINPRARAFAKGKFRNGADPYSMYRTLTDGYGTMPAMDWLTPQERYDVIHYIRETFVKPENPDQYVPIDREYLSKLPEKKTDKSKKAAKTKGNPQFGPGLSWRFGGARAALTVDAGNDVTISYDLHRMRTVDAWTGGFLDLSDTMLENKRAGGDPRRDGRPLPGLDQWQWALNGSFKVGPDDTLAWPPRGPAPRNWMQFLGRYRHGNRTVLSYRIGDRKVLELPQSRRVSGDPVLIHTLEIAPGREALKLAAGDGGNASGSMRGVFTFDGELIDRTRGRAKERVALVSGAWNGDANDGDPFRHSVVAAVAGDVTDLDWQVDDENRLVLHVPPDRQKRTVKVIRFAAGGKTDVLEFAGFARYANRTGSITSPSALTDGGPPQWDETVRVEGKLGKPENGYALDTVPVPFENPYGTWMRTSAVGFFPDGRAVVTTYTGDVWIVSGLDGELDQVTWSRYAAGLYEPLGVQVRNRQVYVTTRYGIVRLHDLNDDGEADFYETFYADPNVRTHWHMFNFDLQVDPEGNFYYAKTGLFNNFDLPPGAVMRVGPDGSAGKVIATGFRVPNGMGMLPDGRPVVSDNEGGWTPSSKISVVENGEFYGFPPGEPPAGPRGNYHPPANFKDPMIWMPQSLDSSSGGQVWAGDGFGPLSNRLLHTSFDPGRMYYVLRQESDKHIDAAAIVGLPFQFDAGVHRARQNPATGQVWATGLSGWGGPSGAEDGCLQRLRWTGENGRVLDQFRIFGSEIILRFPFALDAATAGDPDSYDLAQWNYRWTNKYGSAHYSVENPDREGEDPVPVSSVTVGDQNRSVRLSVDELQPVDQLRIKLNLTDAKGNPFTETLYMTIHHVPR